MDAHGARRAHPPARRWRGRPTRDDERGAVAVEFALILPILLLLVLGIIEFGFGYHAWDVTQNAAREGARLGAVEASESNIVARTRGAASMLDQSQLVVTVTCAPPGTSTFGPCGSWEEGEIVRVEVDYSYGYMTPLPGFVGFDDVMEMTSVAEARFEGL